MFSTPVNMAWTPAQSLQGLWVSPTQHSQGTPPEAFLLCRVTPSRRKSGTIMGLTSIETGTQSCRHTCMGTCTYACTGHTHAQGTHTHALGPTAAQELRKPPPAYVRLTCPCPPPTREAGLGNPSGLHCQTELSGTVEILYHLHCPRWQPRATGGH